MAGMAKSTKRGSANRTPRPAPGPNEPLIQAIEASLQRLTKEALQDELERLARERKVELAERLRPFQTPVSEETMRRSVG